MASHTIAAPRAILERLPWLSEQEIAALDAYCAALVRALSPEHVKSVILYGSKARGDAHAYSDIDLLVMLDPGDEAQKEVECEIASALNLDYGIRIEAFLQSVSLANEMQLVGSPFMQNIARDGVVLLGEGVNVNPIETQRFVKEYMNSTKERLRPAEAAIQVGSYRDSVSRSYYACLDAADAALIARGVIPKSHKGTLDLFSQKLVKPKLVPKQYKDICEHMQRARESADYERGAHVTKAAAERALARAKEFVAMIEQLLPTLLPKDE